MASSHPPGWTADCSELVLQRTGESWQLQMWSQHALIASPHGRTQGSMCGRPEFSRLICALCGLIYSLGNRGRLEKRWIWFDPKNSSQSSLGSGFVPTGTLCEWCGKLDSVIGFWRDWYRRGSPLADEGATTFEAHMANFAELLQMFCLGAPLQIDHPWEASVVHLIHFCCIDSGSRD